MVTVDSKTTTVAGLSADTVEALSAAKQEPAWMRDKRLASWALSQTLAMPSGTEEAWRRTDIRGLHLDAYTPLPPLAAAVHDQRDLPPALLQQMTLPETTVGGRVMHLDGTPVWCRLEAELQQQGVIFCDLDTAVRQHSELVQPHFMTTAVATDHNRFTALHGALWNGGVFLYVPRGIAVTVPLQALTAHATEAGMIQPHTLLIAEEQSQVTLIDEQLSSHPSLTGLHNGVVELHLKAGAHVTYLQLQNWSQRLWGFANQRAVLAADSHLRWAAAGLGSRLHWSSLAVELREPGSSSRIFGLTLTDRRQHLDYQTCQGHLAPHTESDMIFKSALLDRSRVVFRGVIELHPAAQQTNAYQANHSLLLSQHARADALPILEIEADDVRCKHGSTTGRIDDEQVFYLMSRGLSYQEAQRMIVQGFFETVITEFPVEGVQEKLRLAINDRI